MATGIITVGVTGIAITAGAGIIDTIDGGITITATTDITITDAGGNIEITKVACRAAFVLPLRSYK